MRRTRTSVMQVASLKPELEFEVIKLVLLRENYIQKLQKKLSSSSGMLDIGVIGLFDVLREVSVETIETIQTWEMTQVDYPNVKPFLWNGSNYLVKMIDDLHFLNEFPKVLEWMGFVIENNPFLLPPEILDENIKLAQTSFLVFGQRPYFPKKGPKKIKRGIPPLKSPYLTPIVNDPDVIPSLNVTKRLEKADKANSKAKAALEKVASDYSAGADPFESFVSAEFISRVRRCWKVLCTMQPSISFVVDSFSQSNLASVIDNSSARSRGPSESSVLDPSISGTVEPDNHTEVLDAQSTRATTEGFGRSQTADILRKSVSFNETIQKTSLLFPRQDNEKLRLQSIGRPRIIDSDAAVESKTDTRSRLWTPHEIKLQRVVQKRGGELYVLTAAGTKGKIIAPWRKSRFERLEWDLQQMERHQSQLSMTLEDLLARSSTSPSRNLLGGSLIHIGEAQAISGLTLSGKNVDISTHIRAVQDMKANVDAQYALMQYQYEHFKLIMQGSVTGLDKRRSLRHQPEGQALDSDEKLSMSLEDTMAARIQRRVRMRFAAVLRKFWVKKRNDAATRIQGMWRQVRMRGFAHLRSQQLRLALILQRRFRGARGNEQTVLLRRQAEMRLASRVIQRVYRGHRGRKRSKLKKEFMGEMDKAEACIAPSVLTPADVDELADAIDFFCKDYTMDMPEAVLTVVRAILYIFNGSEPEVVRVETAGYVENRYIKAKFATWLGVTLFLRRKGRVLRRLRAMVRHVKLPDGRPLTFTDEAFAHLKVIRLRLQESDFSSLKLGRSCVVQFFRFCLHVARIFELQPMFEEYFRISQPAWFRKSIKLRSVLTEKDVALWVEQKCRERLGERMRYFVKAGLRFRVIANCMRRTDFALKSADLVQFQAKQKYDLFLKKLEESVENSIKTMENLERTRALGLHVAKSDLKEYIRNTIVPEDERLKELYHVIDKKTLDLLATQSSKAAAIAGIVEDRKARDFENILDLNRIRAYSAELGYVKADLMVLGDEWHEFLGEIGGFQFVLDLVGEGRDYYLKTRDEAQRLMKRRRELLQLLDDDANKEFNKAKRLALEAKLHLVDRPWDEPSDVEKKAEAEEDDECSRRDADAEEKKKRQADNVYIPPASWRPTLLLVDSRLPTQLKARLMKRLDEFSFTPCHTWVTEPHALDDIQRILDMKRNAIVFVDRGLHRLARGRFLAAFQAVLLGLLPFPIVLAVDATGAIFADEWFSQRALDHASIVAHQESAECTLSVGKMQRLVEKLKLFGAQATVEIGASSGDDHMSIGSAADSVASERAGRFQEDIRSFFRELAPSRSGQESIMNPNRVLGATLSCIFDFFRPPMSPWQFRHIDSACVALLEKAKNLKALCRILQSFDIRTLEVTRFHRVKPCRAFTAWEYFSKLDAHKFPARYYLSQWCLEALAMLDRVSHGGGGVADDYRNDFVKFTRVVNWKADVCHEDIERIVGDIMNQCLKDALRYEAPRQTLTFFVDGKDLNNLDKEVTVRKKVDCSVRIFYRGNLVYVCADTDQVTGVQTSYFTSINIIDAIKITYPNAIEVYEGRITKYDIREGGSHNLFELTARWTCLDDIGTKFGLRVLRTRCILFSKFGLINGHMARMEIFEEKYGDVVLLIHGVLPSGALEFRVTPDALAALSSVADLLEEKPKIEKLDTQCIATYCSDRVQLIPPKKWCDFLEHGEMHPKVIDRPVKPKLRLQGGPGRMAGRKYLICCGLHLIITIFEIQNDTDSHALRICIYEMGNSQTAEYRVSPMERLALFTDEAKTIFDQIVMRLRTVYCDMRQRGRTLIALGDDFEPRLPRFWVDGTTEYDIRTPDEMSLDAFSRDGVNVDTTEDDDDFSKYNSFTQVKRAGPWGWALYFSRTVVETTRGNLQISVGLSLPDRGFGVYCLDGRSGREAYRFITYSESCDLYADKTEQELYADLRVLDETIVFDLLDALIQMVQVVTDDEGRSQLVLASERRSKPPAVIADVKEHVYDETETPEVRQARLKIISPATKIAVEVLSARKLATVGAFGMRNPYVIVKWNMRELGRTSSAKNTLTPQWEGDDALFSAQTIRGQDIDKCTLEIEVRDADDAKRSGDFLGYLRLTGDPLKEFFEKGTAEESLTFRLGSSAKLSMADNKHAQGKIVLRGSYSDIVRAREAEKARLEAEAAAEANAKKKGSSFIPTISLNVPKGLPTFGLFKSSKSKEKAATAAVTAAATVTEVATEGVKEGSIERASASSAPGEALAVAGSNTAGGVVVLSNQSGVLTGQSQKSITDADADAGAGAGASARGAPGFGASTAGFVADKQTENAMKKDSVKMMMIGQAEVMQLSNDRSGGVDGDNEVEREEGNNRDEADEAEDTADALAKTSTKLDDGNTANDAPPAEKTSLFMFVIASEDIPNATIIVKLNDVEVSRVPVDASGGNKVDLNHYIEVQMPSMYRLSDCSLDFELWTGSAADGSDEGISSLVCKGVMGKRGTKLAKLFRGLAKEPVWLKFSAPAFLRRKNDTDRLGKILISGTAYDEERARILLASRRYSLSVLSAQKLRKTAAFGGRDVTAEVRFNGEILGRTEVMKNTTNPVWPEPQAFDIITPARRPIECCRLEVAFFDSRVNEPLGTKMFTGQALIEVLENSEECPSLHVLTTGSLSSNSRTATPSSRAATPSTPSHRNDSTVEIRVLKPPSLMSKEEMQSLLSALWRSYSGRSMLTSVQDQQPRNVELVVVAARNLPAIGIDGKRDPYVEVYFNNQFQGKTDNAMNTLEPRWGSAEHFVLKVPRGHRIESCCLEVRMYDWDASGRGEHLGSKYIEGRDLLQLIGRGETRKSAEYELERSTAPVDESASSAVDLEDEDGGDGKNGKHGAALQRIEGERIHTIIELRFDAEILEGDEMETDSGMPGIQKIVMLEIAKFEALDQLLNRREAEKRNDVESGDAETPPDRNDSSSLTLTLRWNEQEIRRGIACPPPDGAPMSVCLDVLLGFDFSDCVLELLLWSGESFLGGLTVAGDRLAALFKMSRAAGPDVFNFNPAWREGAGTGVVGDATGGEASRGESAGQVWLRGSVLKQRPPQAEVDAGSKALIAANYVPHRFVHIKTDLTSFITGWAHPFDYVDENAMNLAAKAPATQSSASFRISSRTSKKHQMEMAGIAFLARMRVNEDDDRVCWRGRALPKEFIVSSEGKDAVMMSRSSKVIQTKTIRDMKVLANISYLKEYSDDNSAASNELPVCVREVVSDGPGLVMRMYRVEVSANNGVRMGAADIIDDEDMRRVVGKGGIHLVADDRSAWNLPAIFEYIVTERMILNMMPGKSKPKEQFSRDSAWVQSDSSKISDSTLTLMRDLPDLLDAADLKEEDEGSGPQEKVGDDDESSITTVRKMYWIRIFTKTHKLCGQLLRTLVLLQGDDVELYDNPNHFFSRFDPETGLRQVSMTFRCKNVITKHCQDLSMSGAELLAWLAPGFPVDLRSKFRRAQFGRFMLDNMCIRYNTEGGYDIDLINTEMSSILNNNAAVQVESRKVEYDYVGNDGEDEDIVAPLPASAADAPREDKKSGNFFGGAMPKVKDLASDILGKLSGFLSLPR